VRQAVGGAQAARQRPKRQEAYGERLSHILPIPENSRQRRGTRKVAGIRGVASIGIPGRWQNGQEAHKVIGAVSVPRGSAEFGMWHSIYK